MHRVEHLFWLLYVFQTTAVNLFQCFFFLSSSLFSLLSKKHNKVLEQATQSLRGSLDSNDSPLPDYVSIELRVVVGAPKYRRYIHKPAKLYQTMRWLSNHQLQRTRTCISDVMSERKITQMAKQNHSSWELGDTLSACSFQAFYVAGCLNHMVRSIFKNEALASTVC